MIRSAIVKSVLIGGLFLIAVSANAGILSTVERGEFAALDRPLRVGAKFTIPRVPLADAKLETLELERFQVWADRAEIKVYGANDEVLETLAPPPVQYFRGKVAGQQDSMVFLAVSGGQIDGVIYTTDHKFAIGTRRFDRNSVRVIIQESDVIDDIPTEGQGFTCELDGAQITPASSPRQAVSSAFDVAPHAAPTGTQRTVLNIAVETDYELYTLPNINSNAANVTTFIGNLLGGVSTIYNRDLFADVRVAYLGVHTAAADPFTITPTATGLWNGSSTTYTTSHALAEFGDRWHNSPPSSVPRSAAMLISGKTQTAGVAWTEMMCDSDFLCGPANCGSALFDGHYAGAYSYNGGISANATLTVPNPNVAPYTLPASNYWPLLQVAHELGHNVGSPHTHCIQLTAAQKTQYSVTRDYIDICVQGCYVGTTAVPAEKGTIMSYCHNFYPGYGTNSRFVFGLPNEASELVLLDMRTDLGAETPALSSITAPSSLGTGVAGNASVTNVAGMTYAWTISNGTINSGAGTSSINFTGTTSPVTLTVLATNTQGCSITDYVNVTLTAALAAPTGLVATGTSTSNVALSWNSVPGATGYDILRKAAIGAAFAVVGTSATTAYNDPLVSANTAYLYQVRGTVSGSPGTPSSSDLATTMSYTDPTIALGTTTAKAVHLTELLTAVNAVRALATLSLTSFSTPPLSGGTVTTTPITTLRSALDAARSTLSLTGVSYTDGTLNSGTAIKAAHINDLRGGVQ